MRSVRIIAALTVVFWAVAGCAAREPGAVAEAVQRPRALHTATMTSTVEFEDGQTEEGRMSAHESVGSRSESSTHIAIWDARSAQFLVLFPDERRALRGGPPPPDVIAWLKHLKDSEARHVGEEVVGDKQLLVYEATTTVLGGAIEARTKFWLDPGTALPVRVEQTPSAEEPGVPTRILLRDIQFDVPLKEGLFEAVAPAGYAVTELPAPTSRPAPSVDAREIRNVDGWSAQQLAEVGISIRAWEHAMQRDPVKWARVVFDCSRLSKQQDVVMAALLDSEGALAAAVGSERKAHADDQLSLVIAVDDDHARGSTLNIFIWKDLAKDGPPAYEYKLSLQRVFELARQGPATGAK